MSRMNESLFSFELVLLQQAKKLDKRPHSRTSRRRWAARSWLASGPARLWDLRQALRRPVPCGEAWIGWAKQRMRGKRRAIRRICDELIPSAKRKVVTWWKRRRKNSRRTPPQSAERSSGRGSILPGGSVYNYLHAAGLVCWKPTRLAPA